MVRKVTGSHFKVFNIYEPMHYGEKYECCKSIEDEREIVGKDHCIFVGDLNIVLSQNEKRGRSLVRDNSI